MKILTVLGARPQFIKASVVSNALSAHSSLSEVIVHTGQHYDHNMSEIFFDELGIAKPRYNLGIGGGLHGAMTGRMLIDLEILMQKEQPDVVLVYGDTNSTLAGALAAAKLHIPIAHVEAGLRSRNMKMPEEVNRILTDRLSQWLFTPTEDASQNLLREGIASGTIFEIGDVMYDVALHFGKKSRSRGGDILCELGVQEGRYVLATIHRAENTDDESKMGTIVESLSRVSQEIPVVWPLHPRTGHALRALDLMGRLGSRVKLIPPQSYLEMVRLEQYASVIVTDSGGVQKEAYFHRVPCVTLREETEWVELVAAGWNSLCPPIDSSSVYESITQARTRIGSDRIFYGDGHAAQKIAMVLLNAGKASKT